MVNAKTMSKADRPRARQRTSEVKKSLTARTNRRPVTRSKATGCSLIDGLGGGEASGRGSLSSGMVGFPPFRPGFHQQRDVHADPTRGHLGLRMRRASSHLVESQTILVQHSGEVAHACVPVVLVEVQSKTERHRVVVFRPLLAERVVTTVKKGAHVLVEGSLVSSTYGSW